VEILRRRGNSWSWFFLCSELNSGSLSEFAQERDSRLVQKRYLFQSHLALEFPVSLCMLSRSKLLEDVCFIVDGFVCNPLASLIVLYQFLMDVVRILIFAVNRIVPFLNSFNN